MQIKRLLATDINQDYLETLNDQHYMRFSRNSITAHSLESQSLYVNSFDKGTLKPDSILLGIFENGQLVGTMTTYFNWQKKSANVGILVFRKYSSIGLGKGALSALSYWIKARFPLFSIELGTTKSNLAMQRLALSCGYQARNEEHSRLVYFDYVEQIDEKPYDNLGSRDGETLFFGTDTGGVEAILEFYVRTRTKKYFMVQGRGLGVLDYYGLASSPETLPDLRGFSSLVFATGADASQSQSLQKVFSGAEKTSIGILDNWVNYHSRFNLPNGRLPNLLIVTNEIAYEIAKTAFPNQRLLLTPDYRIERLRRLLTVDMQRAEKSVLLVLEPERPKLEGLGRITFPDIVNSIKKAKHVARELGLNRVNIRLHPTMGTYKEIREIISRDDFISLSTNLRVEDDLPSCKAVVGFSSSVLYSSAKLGISTHSLLEFSKESWLGRCRDIKKFVSN